MFLRRKAIDPLTDEDLIARIHAGDQASLGVLWDRYAHLLFGVGMKYLKDTERSKDQVLELFTTLPDLLAKHAVKNFRSWVHTVMRNRCLMELRGYDRSKGLEGPLADEPEELTHEAALHEATLQQLERAIDGLKEGQRECIRLFYLQRMSYMQVAERTGLDLEQVRSNLQNGRRNLRIHLERHAHDETL